MAFQNATDSKRIAEELLSEEAMLEDWPRRLLHVATWTSYEWQPGNVYGGKTAPPYNAISYTWGRWRLSENSMPDIGALSVRNTTWQIPRVQPEHFSVEEFATAVQQACSLRPCGEIENFRLPGEPEPEAPTHAEIEFLWLDIACIDQRWGSVKSAAEIGRQAQIFRGASTVFAWLTTHTVVSLERLFTRLSNLTQSIDHSRIGRKDSTKVTKLLYETLEISKTLVSDPWFSSLRALQEAFLRQDAFILSREGEAVEFHEYGTVHVRLSHLTQVCGDLSSLCKGLDLTPAQPVDQELYALIDSKGLAQLDTQSPMAVYGAASHRTASEACDYVYGIQQIFDLRLGTTSVSADRSRAYTRLNLEEQLGQALIEKVGFKSQCYVYSQPTERGAAWRINMNAVVPENPPFDLFYQTTVVVDQRCVLSTISVNGRLYGHFVAKTCTLKDMADVCYRVDWADGNIEYSMRNASVPTLRYFPDVTDELIDGSEYSLIGIGGMDFFGVQNQQRYRRYLLNSFVGDQAMQVTLLGYVKGKESNGGYHSGCFGIGLLLVANNGTGRQDERLPEWRRLGLCAWDANHRTLLRYPTGLTLDRPFLMGNAGCWIERAGTFG